MVSPREVIDGALLSDAGIASPYVASHLTMALSGAEHIDWLHAVKAALDSLSVEVCAGHPRLLSRVDPWGRQYVYCYMKTKASQFIDSERERWYNKGRKEVPGDLVVTPTLLAHWFMGDGNSHKDDRCCSVTVSLCSQSYDLESIEVLEEQLRLLGLNTGRAHVKVKVGSGILITIRQDSVDRFMSIIEPYMVSSYKYKVIYRTNVSRCRAGRRVSSRGLGG